MFELDPNLKNLFRDNMQEQGKNLMQMISISVNGLSRLDSIVPAVEDLGRRHVEYNVVEEDYDTVGAALLWTLSQGLGEKFTPQVEQAWAETYKLLATTMKDAAAKKSI